MWHKAMTNADAMRSEVAAWLCKGVTPFRLALTLALGFAIGCIPVLGIPTVLCAGLALGFGLNLPAIQAANYAAMPLQLVLILPFVRLGQRIFAWGPHPGLTPAIQIHPPTFHFASLLASQMAWLAAQAVLAWMLVAGPAVVLLTVTLTPVLKRIPAFVDGQAGS
jgi:uncharacterized protein (DUF2062 family)